MQIFSQVKGLRVRVGQVSTATAHPSSLIPGAAGPGVTPMHSSAITPAAAPVRHPNKRSESNSKWSADINVVESTCGLCLPLCDTADDALLKDPYGQFTNGHRSGGGRKVICEKFNAKYADGTNERDVAVASAKNEKRAAARQRHLRETDKQQRSKEGQ